MSTNTGKDNTGNWNSGDLNSGNWNSGNWNSGNWNSGNWNSGDLNSGNWNSGNWNSGNLNSGNRNSGDLNSGNWNSGNRNSGDLNSGNRNSGDLNSGNWNSGWFNTNEPKARFFNKETNMTLTEFYNSDKVPYIDLPLNVWVYKEDMTNKEKEEVKGWETMGGYLKTLEYKEAFKIAWKELDEVNKQKFLNLPNFDAEIFKEITGVDVESKEDEEVKEAIKLLEKKGVLKDGKVIV